MSRHLAETYCFITQISPNLLTFYAEEDKYLQIKISEALCLHPLSSSLLLVTGCCPSQDTYNCVSAESSERSK